VRLRRSAPLLLALATLACSSTPKTPEPASERGRPTWIAVHELAKRLDLDVETSSSRGAMLRNEANTVSLFPEPGGRAYVNGKAVGAPGEVVTRVEVVHVTPDLLETIRAALVAAAPPPPPPPVAPDRPEPGPRPEPTPRLGLVVIDPGHGGRQPGTPRERNGLIDEKTVNLDASLRLERHLRRAGVDVVLTRRTDVTMSLEARPALSNRYRPQLFVSIHADGAEDRRAHGFTVYVARKASRGTLDAAERIRRQMARTGVKDRGVRRADYRVLVKSHGPAVLVELGFLTNPAEASRLVTPSHREKMAAAIARGIVSYLLRP
jgi:N-acetylmuramoyl-L-alanine amidase